SLKAVYRPYRALRKTRGHLPPHRVPVTFLRVCGAGFLACTIPSSPARRGSVQTRRSAPQASRPSKRVTHPTHLPVTRQLAVYCLSSFPSLSAIVSSRGPENR